MPAKHRASISTDLRDALLRAGVGAAYHKQTLADQSKFGGQEVGEQLGAIAVSGFRQGMGITLVTARRGYYQTMIIAMKKLVELGLSVRIVALPTLMDWCDQVATGRPSEWLAGQMESLAKCDVLTVHGFYGPHMTSESHPPRSLLRVAELIRERMDQAKSVCILADMTPAKTCPIWDHDKVILPLFSPHSKTQRVIRVADAS